MHKRIDSRARLALGLLSLMGTSVSDKAHAQPDESDEAELSASFQYDAATQTLQTKYFFHNSAAYPLVVFDRGDSRGRRASEPVQLTDQGDSLLTLRLETSHASGMIQRAVLSIFFQLQQLLGLFRQRKI